MSISIIPRCPVIEDRVDVAEVNHFYDENGRLVFDQLIYYRWCDEACRFQVVAWRLLKHPSQMPVRDFRRGGYSAAWVDGETMRLLRHGSVRESWTQFDPELVERSILPRESRRELSKEGRKPPIPPESGP